MKQLSLLVLAGLTTGCFAAEQEQPKVSCWEFVALLRGTIYRAELNSTYSADTDILTIGGFADCADKYDQLERLAHDKSVNSTDHEILADIHMRLAKRLNRHAYSSLEAAIKRDEANIEAAAAFAQNMRDARANLHLLSEKMELPSNLK